MSQIGKFFKSVLSNWISSVSGIVSVAFTIVGFLGLINQQHGALIWFGMAAACFFLSSYVVWLKEHHRANKAEADLAAATALDSDVLNRITTKLRSFEETRLIVLKELLDVIVMTERDASKSIRDKLTTDTALKELDAETHWLKVDGDKYTISPLFVPYLRKAFSLPEFQHISSSQ